MPSHVHRPLSIPAFALVVALILTAVGALSAGSDAARAAGEPTVISVSPATGVAGTEVIITGTNFSYAMTVFFGSNPAAFDVENSTTITATAPTPDQSFDFVSVTVTNPNGSSIGDQNSLFYYAGGTPAVTSISPSTGTAGTVVTINGTNFTGATSVAFGAASATPYDVTANQLKVVVPAGTPGAQVSLLVTGPGGASQNVSADNFTYSAAVTGPTITNVSPSSGNIGTPVTLTGTGFTGATTVSFGGNNGTGLSVQNSTTATVIAPAGNAGSTVDVRITTGQGTSPVSANAKFTYSTGPVITGVSPSSGASGTLVTITGTGLSGTTIVSFGNADAAPENVSSTQITVLAPIHSAGIVNVTVTNGVGTSPISANAKFTYGSGPVITSITPTSGSAGTTVTITGTGLTGTNLVNFGGSTTAPATVSATTVTVVAPTHPNGLVDVTVTNTQGTSATHANARFTYGIGPVITSLTPTFGPAGTLVTITGTSLLGTTNVFFGSTVASPLSVSSTQVTVFSPSGPSGLVNVTVTNGVATSPTHANAQYTYGTGPVITSIAPESGTTGTSVVITGTGFTGATGVTFDGIVSAFTVNSNTQITATAPTHVAGEVDVRVTTAAGTSAIHENAKFIYSAIPVFTTISPNNGTTGTVVTITGSNLAAVTVVNFGGTFATPTSATNTTITVLAPFRAATGPVLVVLTSPAGTSAASRTFTYNAPGDGNIEYELSFRWTLIAWLGPHGASVESALKGQLPGTGLTNIFGQVTAIYRWNPQQQKWEANFPGTNIPGANDFTVFDYGQGYWIAISNTNGLDWVVPAD